MHVHVHIAYLTKVISVGEKINVFSLPTLKKHRHPRNITEIQHKLRFKLSIYHVVLTSPSDTIMY